MRPQRWINIDSEVRPFAAGILFHGQSWHLQRFQEANDRQLVRARQRLEVILGRDRFTP